jgi:glycine/serine hydroxymethyltransferase
MGTVARFIGRALDSAGDEAALKRLKAEVAEFTRGFPLYRSRLAKG